MHNKKHPAWMPFSMNFSQQNSNSSRLILGDGVSKFKTIDFYMNDYQKKSIELKNITTYLLVASHAAVGTGMYLINSYSSGGIITIIKEYPSLIVTINNQTLTVDAEKNHINVRTNLYAIGLCG